MRYSDPTGHKLCDDFDDDGKCITSSGNYSTGKGRTPEYINRKKLTESGKKGYETYLKLFYSYDQWWWKDAKALTGDGDFTVADFVTMIKYEEGGQIAKADFFPLWEETIVRSYYNWTKGDEEGAKFGSAGLLNYMYAQSGTRTRTEPSSFDGDADPAFGIPKMIEVTNAMFDPTSVSHAEWAAGCVGNVPCQMGSYNKEGPNLNYINGFRKAGCPSFALFYSCGADMFIFFLTQEQANHWQAHPDPQK